MSTVLEEKPATDRRNKIDRRSSGDRRRQADPRWPVLEVSQSMLRLALVVQRSGSKNDVVVTRCIPWRIESKRLHSDLGVQELTDAFRQVVAEEKLGGAKVRLVLAGELCVTRVVAGSAAEVRKEMSEVEERSQHYLSLGPGKKAVAKSVRQLDARHQLAVLCVTNLKTLELLIRISELVGFHILSIEPSLVALTRAQANTVQANGMPAILVQVYEGSAELGICSGGQLLLDYRPAGRTGPEHVAGDIAKHVYRLERYLERRHGLHDVELRDVYLTGDSGAVERAHGAFANLSRFNVRTLRPSDIQAGWEFQDEQPGTEMTAVLGGAITKYHPELERNGPNLIEQFLAQSREPLRPVLLRSLIPMAAMILVALVVAALDWREDQQIAGVRERLDKLAPLQARADELRLTLTRNEGLLAQLQEIEKKLPQPTWSVMISRVAANMPRDVWLDRLAVQDGFSASLNGASYSDGGVYDFVNNMKQVPEVDQIMLKGTGIGQSPAGPTTSFDIDFDLAKFNDQPKVSDQDD